MRRPHDAAGEPKGRGMAQWCGAPMVYPGRRGWRRRWSLMAVCRRGHRQCPQQCRCARGPGGQERLGCARPVTVSGLGPAVATAGRWFESERCDALVWQAASLRYPQRRRRPTSFSAGFLYRRSFEQMEVETPFLSPFRPGYRRFFEQIEVETRDNVTQARRTRIDDSSNRRRLKQGRLYSDTIRIDRSSNRTRSRQVVRLRWW